jgi:hypothetical protein
MAPRTRFAVSIPVAPDTGSRIHASIDPVLGQVIPPVGHQITVRLVPMADVGSDPSLGCVAVHAEGIAVTAVAQILILGSVGSVPLQETPGMMECSMGFPGVGGPPLVAF